MINALYFILVVVTALVSTASGFRRGITGLTAPLLGFAFGAVVARVLAPALSDYFQWTSSISQAPEFLQMTSELICASTVYFVVFWLFYLLKPIFRIVLQALEVGMFNRLLGAFFCLLKNLLWVSIALNIFLCLSPGSRLLEYEKANDGNLIAAVMTLTPGVLGCFGAEDFAHFHQLKVAKTISRNFIEQDCVILKGKERKII